MKDLHSMVNYLTAPARFEFTQYRKRKAEYFWRRTIVNEWWLWDKVTITQKNIFDIYLN